MTTLAPVSVALKFGFLAVLYLFVLWVARSARRDLRARRHARRRRARSAAAAPIRPTPPACTPPPRSAGADVATRARGSSSSAPRATTRA